jgi:hypothetical protein
MNFGLCCSHPPGKRQRWCGPATPRRRGVLALQTHQPGEFGTQDQAPGSTCFFVVGSAYFARLMCVLSSGIPKGVECPGRRYLLGR